MAIKVLSGGVWKTPPAAKVFSSGAWRDAVALRIYSGATWRLITFASSGSAMSLSISPSPFAFVASGPTVTGTLTATPSAGISPYSYLWTITADSGSAAVNRPDVATITATSGGLRSGETETVSLHCVATDALGNTASANVSGTFHRT